MAFEPLALLGFLSTCVSPVMSVPPLGENVHLVASRMPLDGSQALALETFLPSTLVFLRLTSATVTDKRQEQ